MDVDGDGQRRTAPSSIFDADRIFGRRADFDFNPRPADEATSLRPGSKEKVNLLRHRLETGQELWHPDDEPVPQLPPRARVSPGKSRDLAGDEVSERDWVDCVHEHMESSRYGQNY
jgi:hypothetical protein